MKSLYKIAQSLPHRRFAAAFFLAPLVVAGCVSEVPGDPASAPGEADAHDENTGQIAEGLSNSTVAAAAAASCATASVMGLSFQIIEEGNCIEPGAFAPLSLPSSAHAGSNIFLFIQKPARDKLASLLAANPGKSLTINSMLRTVAQQYLLWSWYQSGDCGISLAAEPGNSNHETGLAMDIQEYSSWRSTLESSGFDWLGSSDPWHFDWVGSSVVDHGGLDVLAFQRLWNRNNPSDLISEDGSWGSSTESRMRKAPADGFPKGASCGPASEPACKASFSDICGSPHRSSIDWMAKQGLTTGCGGGKYCPNQTVTRRQMAGFLASALKLPAGPDKFTDDNGTPFEASINAVAAAGITNGCNVAGTKYCPEEEVTRAEMATFLARAFKLPASASDAFRDDEASMHEAKINALRAAGVTSGCDAVKKLYCPDSPVTRGQMATFIDRAMK